MYCPSSAVHLQMFNLPSLLLFVPLASSSLLPTVTDSSTSQGALSQPNVALTRLDLVWLASSSSLLVRVCPNFVWVGTAQTPCMDKPLVLRIPRDFACSRSYSRNCSSLFLLLWRARLDCSPGLPNLIALWVNSLAPHDRRLCLAPHPPPTHRRVSKPVAARSSSPLPPPELAHDGGSLVSGCKARATARS